MGFLDRLRRVGPRPDDLFERVLLVPTPDTGEEPRGPEVLAEDREIAFVLVHDEDGLPVLPAFTSEDALLRWNPGGSRYVGLQGKALVEILAGSDWDRIVVDTAGPEAFAITRSAARELLGAVPFSVPAGSTLAIGQPAQAPPDGFVSDLRRACEDEAAVAEAFLYQLGVLERDELPHLTIGLRLDAGVDEEEAERIAQAIGHAADPQSWGYEFVDFQLLEGDMLDTVRSAATTIFRRSG
jgi:SseB protein N-terminal domain/SseB protein C-terminal domain